MRFTFLKLLHRTLLHFFPEVVCDSVVSNDYTIASALVVQ